MHKETLTYKAAKASLLIPRGHFDFCPIYVTYTYVITGFNWFSTVMFIWIVHHDV